MELSQREDGPFEVSADIGEIPAEYQVDVADLCEKRFEPPKSSGVEGLCGS